jgi:hypothetical protein
MSTKQRTHLVASFFGRGTQSLKQSKETPLQPQTVPSPPATPRLALARGPDGPPRPATEERVITSEELQQSVEALETVLRTMDQVRDQTNRFNAVLREHARALREYAVGVNMIVTRDENGRVRGVDVGEDRVSERLIVHCASYYDRLAEAQEMLVRLARVNLMAGSTISRGVQYFE